MINDLRLRQILACALFQTISFLIAPHSFADFAPSCPRMSLENNCSLYDKCLESKNKCGISGYPLRYGLKFCNRFLSMELSNNGEQWIGQTMLCLQDELVKFADNKTDCGVLQETAFKSHVECYVRAGFCELSLDDKASIAGANFWATVTSLAGVVQAASTLSECWNKE